MLRALQEEYILTVTMYDELHFLVSLMTLSVQYISMLVKTTLRSMLSIVSLIIIGMLSLIGCCLKVILRRLSRMSNNYITNSVFQTWGEYLGTCT